MPAQTKIRILLADEDVLRRDGMAAVLAGSDQFEVVAAAADGVAALELIRDWRPDAAVVDLNLPKLHGIELVRRVRSELPGTKVIVVSGTSDEEVVREAVRAGADGFLLKNGPARHLMDAISYVRDGGQYFSPQLHRDGWERHLLQEPPRSAPHAAQFRERIREESPKDLNEHDFEVMSMMADGIRPILDRLDEIDSRVAQMETGDAPVPSDPRGWLSTQFADTVRNSGAGLNALEVRLPELIEDAVSQRFHQMAERLQQEIEETHVRTLETFVKNIQVKLVQRVSVLEQDMSRQAQAMGQLRDSSQRTEENLSRLISGVDKLAQELPRRLAAAPQEPSVRPARAKMGRPKSNRTLKMLWAAACALLLIIGLTWAVMHFAGASVETRPPVHAAGSSRALPSNADSKTDSKTKMQAAQESVDRKDYAVAEDLYKQIVKAEPANVDALKALASVLYREEKIDESAAILDRLSKN